MTVAQGLLKTTAFVKQSGLGVPGSSGSQIVRRTQSAFSLSRATYVNNEIVNHQQSTGQTAGVKQTAGKIDGLLSAGTWSKLLGSLLRKDFAATASLTGVSVTIAGSGPTYTVTRASGSYLTDGAKIGDVIRLSVGALNAANISKNLLITALTATVATVIPLNGVAMVAEGPITGTTVSWPGKKSIVPTSGHTNDYYTFEEWYSDVSRSELFTDVKVSKADIALPATGNATISLDVPGLGRTLGASQVCTSPAAATTTDVLTAVNGAVLINGTTTPITGASISINGQIQPGQPEVGANTISDHVRGRIDVSGSFTAKFTTATLSTIYDAQTKAALVVVLASDQTATADFVSFSMSELKLFSDTPNDGEAVEIVRTYAFTAELNGSGGAALANDQTIVSIQDSQAP